MAGITGLKNIAAAFAPREERPKVPYLQLDDGKTARIRIMGEFDESSPNYDPNRGLSQVKVTHTSPFNWKRTAECTAQNGKCLACEFLNDRSVAWEDKKGWRASKRLYMNVLVNGKDVAVWQPNFTLTNILIDTVTELEMDSVSNRVFVLKRNGIGRDTSYTLFPKGGEDTEPFDWNGFEPFDLSQVPAQVPYEDQARFYDVPQVTVDIDEPSEDDYTFAADENEDDLQW